VKVLTLVNLVNRVLPWKILSNRYNKKKFRIMSCMMTDCLKGLNLKIVNSIDMVIDLIALFIEVI
jgi:hypothetical protein